MLTYAVPGLDHESWDNLHQLANCLIEHGTKPLGDTSRGRVIALVGAGASVPAGIPASKQLKEKIQEIVINGGLIHEEALKRELNKPLSMASLEEFTQVACKYLHVRDKVLAELNDICLASPQSLNDSLPPLLCYEILAHLVKHGFIDHVISMNFDEILDEALENEVGREALFRIVSEQDLIGFTELPPYKAGLVKPHGTISLPRSLRFTRENVAMFPAEIADFIQKEILISHSNKPSHFPQTTLVVVGFSMHDLEINRILSEATLAQIYRIDVTRPGSTVPNGFGETCTAGGESSLLRTLERPIISAQGANDIFSKLWELMAEKAPEENLTLEPIAKHRLLSTIFQPSESLIFD